MKGFTLLEVMVALAIMAGVVLTVITSFNYQLSLVGQDREETVALLLARSKIDDPGFRTVSVKKGSFAPEWPEFTWATETTPSQVPLVDRMVLTVSWDNERRKVALVQYVKK